MKKIKLKINPYYGFNKKRYNYVDKIFIKGCLFILLLLIALAIIITKTNEDAEKNHFIVPKSSPY